MSTKLDFQLKLLVHQRQLELSFFKIDAKHKLFLFRLIYSVGHQGQDNFYLDKSIVSWIESLQIDRCNHAMCLIVPLCGVLAILKK